MTFSNSDFAPAIIVFITFYVVAAYLFVRQLWTSRNSEWVPAQSPPGSITGLIVIATFVYLIMYVELYLIVANISRFVNLTEHNKHLIEYGVAVALPPIMFQIVVSLIVRRRPLPLVLPDRTVSLWDQMLGSNTEVFQWILVPTIIVDLLSSLLSSDTPLDQVTVAMVIFIFITAFRWLNYTHSGSSQTAMKQSVQSAIVHGHYKQAMRRCRGLQAAFYPDCLYLSGTVLLFAGYYAEAEAIFRECLQMGNMDNHFLGFALTNLGYAFAHQGRYPESIQAFEEAHGLEPHMGYPLHGLAETYLFEGTQPQRALDLTTDYLHNHLSDPISTPLAWAEILADKAWALALLGQPMRAKVTLVEAFKKMDQSFKPGMAGIHFRAGQVYKIDEHARALKLFKRAIEFDPEGSWGKLARQALQALNGY